MLNQDQISEIKSRRAAFQARLDAAYSSERPTDPCPPPTEPCPPPTEPPPPWDWYCEEP